MEEPCSNGPTYWIWRRFRISGCLHTTNHSQCVKDCLLWNVVEEVLLDPAALQNGCEGVLPLAMDSVSCSAARPPAPSRADVMRSNSMALRCLKRRWSSAFSMGDCVMLHSVTTDSAADSWKTSKWACSTGSDKTNVIPLLTAHPEISLHKAEGCTFYVHSFAVSVHWKVTTMDKDLRKRVIWGCLHAISPPMVMFHTLWHGRWKWS